MQRLRGELLVVEGATGREEARNCFERALAVARAQTFKALELRAATSLARLWHTRERRKEAWALLASIYGFFTEGSDTPDLTGAKALLDELRWPAAQRLGKTSSW